MRRVAVGLISFGIGLLGPTAWGGLISYPLQVDFKSQQVCQAVNENLDKAPGAGFSKIDATCKDGKLIGDIITVPGSTSLELRIVWSQKVQVSCMELMKHFQDARKSTRIDCEGPKKIPWASLLTLAPDWIPQLLAKLTDPYSSPWVATFSFPLKDGQDIDELQRKRIDHIEEEQRFREQAEDARIFGDPGPQKESPSTGGTVQSQPGSRRGE